MGRYVAPAEPTEKEGRTKLGPTKEGGLRIIQTFYLCLFMNKEQCKSFHITPLKLKPLSHMNFAKCTENQVQTLGGATLSHM